MKSIRLLVIDDDSNIQTILKFSLERYNHLYSVEFCKTAEEGFLLLNTKSFDLILLDFYLNHSNAFDFIDNYLSFEPHPLPIILLTGSTEDFTDRNLIIGQITKPFDPLKIGESIARLYFHEEKAA